MKFSKNAEKKKGAAVAVICFVAAIAITGTYTFNDYKKSKSEKEIAMAKEDVTKEKYTVIEGESLVDEPVDGEIVSNEAEIVEEENTIEEDSGNENVTKEASISNAANINFTNDSLMLWPVSGALLMDYSMDKTVYFKTLDQYKYNPAIVIAAAENDVVIAGAPGLVKSIDNSVQTGTTVTVDFGNGYEALYGQLQTIAVKTGDYVEATTTLGYVAMPTKYYSKEGSNLYFEMRKDGQPINPKDYLTDYVE